MKSPFSDGLGICAAAAVLAVPLVAALSFSLGLAKGLVVGLGISIALAALVLVPVVAVLHRVHALRWLWLAAAGYFSGFVLYGAFLAATRDDPFAIPMSVAQILIASALGGVLGVVCVSAYWFSTRWLMRPNTSLERTREG